MKKFSIRLVEYTTERGFGDFSIAAETAEAATAALYVAYKIAKSEQSNIVKLADGQMQLIERLEVVDRSVSFVLLDEHGTEVRTVTTPNGRTI